MGLLSMYKKQQKEEYEAKEQKKVIEREEKISKLKMALQDNVKVYYRFYNTEWENYKQELYDQFEEYLKQSSKTGESYCLISVGDLISNFGKILIREFKQDTEIEIDKLTYSKEFNISSKLEDMMTYFKNKGLTVHKVMDDTIKVEW